jgi:hypothetical protein
MKKLVFLSVSILFLLQLNAQNKQLIQKLVASDRSVSDYYGRSVSISGDFAIVGAYLEEFDINGGNYLPAAGAAYIYERNSNGVFTEVQKICSSNRESNGNFGYSVSIDSNYAIVGAWHESLDANGLNTMSYSGAAYIYERSTVGTWNLAQKVVATDRAVGDQFGISVSISGDYAIIGASYHDNDVNGANYLQNAGSVYFFHRDSAGSWNQVQKIVSSDRELNGDFGHSVSIHNDYAIVGAHNESKDITGGNWLPFSGTAYILNRDSGGTWFQVQKITASDRDINDLFGESVCINGDYAIVGAYHEDHDNNGNNSLNNPGAAYIFEKDSLGSWTQVKKIVASDRMDKALFGYSVSIEKETAIVGAYKDGAPNSIYYAGAAYMFKRDGNGNWCQLEKLVAPNRKAVDLFGSSVSISDGIALIGAYMEDEDANELNPVSEAGSAYLFSSCNSINTIHETVCQNYTSPSGNYTWVISGTYTDTLTNAAGCDSIIMINLVIKVDTSVTRYLTTNGATMLHANQTGASYQWLDCDNAYAVLPGSTNQNFSPTQIGNYAVEITKDGCVDTSSCYVVTLVGIAENYYGSSIKLYPNPTTGSTAVYLNKTYKSINVTIRNIMGKVIQSKVYNSTNQLSIEIKDSPGIYIIEVRIDNGDKTLFKVVKR